MSKEEFFLDLDSKLKRLPEEERKQIRKVYEDLFQKALENGKNEQDVAESLGYRPKQTERQQPVEPQDSPPSRPFAGFSRNAADAPRSGGSIAGGAADAPRSGGPFDGGTADAPRSGGHFAGGAADVPRPGGPFAGGAADAPRPGGPFAGGVADAPRPGGPIAGGDTYRTRSGDNGWRVLMAGVALTFFNLIFVLAPFIAIAAALFTITVVSIVLVFSPVFIFMGTGIPETIIILRMEIFGSLFAFGIGLLLLMIVSRANKWFLLAVKKYVRLNIRLMKGQ